MKKTTLTISDEKMPHFVARMTAIAATLCLVSALGQAQQHEADSPNYSLFLLKVASLKVGPILLNGQDAGLTQPSIQQLIGLTDTEVEILRRVAATYTDNVRILDESVRPFIFEARLRSIDLADPDRSRISDRLIEIGNQRKQLVQASVDELKVQFGETRFEAVQVYIRSKKDGNFFPPSGRPKAVVFNARPTQP